MESKLIGTLKTILICVLFVGAIIMSYLSFDTLQKRYGDESDASLTEISSGELSGSDRLPEAFIIPEIAAVKKSGAHMNAISSGAEYMNDIYRLITKDIVFANENCIAENADGMLLWEMAVASDEFIYVRYHSSLPASLILLDALSADERDDFEPSNGGDIRQIYELLICPSNTNSGMAFALSRDTRGNCTEYRIRTESDAELARPEDFDIYVNASALTTADFYGIKSKDQLLIPTTVLFASGLNSRKISVAEGASGITEDTELQSKLALILDINPSKTGSYYENDAVIYMPTHGEFSISSNEIVYSTDHNESGGVSLSSVIGGKNDAENVSLYRMMLASDILIKEIKDADKALLGNEAELFLCDAYREDESFILEYKYSFANIPLADMPTACKLTMKNGKLMRLEIHPISVTFSVTDRLRCFPQSIITSVIEKGGATGEPYGSTLVYRYGFDEKFHTAEWRAVSIN